MAQRAAHYMRANAACRRPDEATTVHISCLSRPGCVRRSKRRPIAWVSRPSAARRRGTERGGKPFSRGHLYGLLSNPIYVGRLRTRANLPRPASGADRHRDLTAVGPACRQRDNPSTQGRCSRAEYTGGLAGRCPGRATHSITRRQEGPALSLLRGRNRSRARLAACCSGSRGCSDQHLGRHLEQPGEVARMVR